MTSRPKARTAGLLCAGLCFAVLGLGCEDKQAMTDEVGGAAKAQLDKVEERVGEAADKQQQKLDEAAKGDDEGGW